ncbi:MAG: rhomboid family intramembrane serine protease [Planctomycetota bacterium]
MGISDRQYNQAPAYRDGPISGRFGSPVHWSINTWIIVANCLVFVLSAMMQTSGVPVLRREVDRSLLGEVEISPVFLLRNGSFATPQDLKTAGRLVIQPLVYKGTNQPVLTPEGAPRQGAEYVVMDPLTAYGHFSTYTGFSRLQVWRLVTFQFLHASVMHIGFNMLGLYMFGTIVEEALGRKKYLAFYLVCGIFGGLSYLLLNIAGYVNTQVFHWAPLPAVLIDEPTTSLVGASAGVFGVIMACAKLRPKDRVTLLFPPVELTMRMLAYGYVVLAALNLLFRGSNAGGDAAHIGGAVAGYFFIRHSHLLTDFFDIVSDSRRTSPPAPRGTVRSVVSASDQAAIDRVLAKVREGGLQSLNDSERALLRSQTEKLQRRAE